MPPYTSSQRSAIKDFADATGVKESTAVKHLKAVGWNLNTAVDTYFQKAGAPSGKPSLASSLNKIFDQYRDDDTSPDQIGAEGTMAYLKALGVSLEETVMLAVLSQARAPTMGELVRTDFVQGWEACGAESMDAQRTQVSRFRSYLGSDADFFQTVYRHSFILARLTGQRAVNLDTAIDFWRMLFSPSGLDWKDSDTDWLNLYVDFLEKSWGKSVSKDVWDQTLMFARKTLADGTLGWWSEEDSAWPSVIDDFIRSVKAKREEGADRMDVG